MRALSIALCALLAGCPAPGASVGAHATSPIAPHAAAVPAPRLVVLLVVDQLPAWSFDAKRAALTGGFDRLLREGAWHTGLHPSAATITAPGHALLGTGQPSATSGIIGNAWWDRDANAVVEAVRDPQGKVTTEHLRVPGLGDALAAAHAGKAVSVSLKDRAAILPLGHTGTAIWYDAKAVSWASLAPVPWLAAYDKAHPIPPRLHEVWTPLDPAKLAELSGVPDAQPGELGDRGFGPTFPHDPRKAKDPANTVFVSPLGNDLVLELATAAIDSEQLGADDVPDLLVVSLSANDYIGHAWGHESWEAWDELLRLDTRLAQFLADLDAKVGAGKWAMIATSDHGASPMPKGSITYEQIADAANRAAATEIGGGPWIADAHYPTVNLSAKVPDKDKKAVLKKIVYALRSFPGLERVERTSDFAGHCEQRTGDALALCLTIDPERSGEVIYLPREGWIIGPASEPHTTAHGSLHAYDREVPVIVVPPGRTPHAALTSPDATRIPMAQIAPMLARWLGVPAPGTE